MIKFWKNHFLPGESFKNVKNIDCWENVSI